MSRRRFLFQQGTITDSPLALGAVTFNSAALAGFPAITGSDYAVITLDPDALVGIPEVVYITAHTASATSATISRGNETADGGSVARQHPVNTKWIHTCTVQEFTADIAPGNSAPGDGAQVGVGDKFARADHQHGRESYATQAVGLATGTPAATLRDGGIILPPGFIGDYAGTTAPAGWLLCDGSAVSRTTYAALFAAAGTNYGAGNGTTTFNVPDSRGRVAVGTGTGTGLTARSIGATGGEEAHANTLAETAVHTHVVTDPGHLHVINAHSHAVTDPGHTHTPANADRFVSDFGSGNAGLSFTAAGQVNPNTAPAATNISIVNATATMNSQTTGITNQNAGSGTAHNTMQPYLVATKIIKT